MTDSPVTSPTGESIVDYNFSIDNSAESKFGTRKELIVLNILKHKNCVNKSRDITWPFY